jgi:hypothetical protein
LSTAKVILARSRPWLLIIYYTLLGVFITWPLTLHLSKAVAGALGDNIYFVWLIGWYQRAIFDLHISPLFNPWMNYPEGWNLSTTDTAFSTTLPGVAFSLAFGPTAGYNLAAIFTFVLSGLTMHWWVRRLTGLRSAGLVAGTIFACLPYRSAHFLAGHLNLMGTQWFPLFFMGLTETFADREKRFPWRWILLTAAALGLIAFSSMYYLYMGLLITAVFAAAFLPFGGWRRLAEKAFWLRLGALAACSLPMLLAALRPFLSLSSAGELADRPWEYARMYSASLADFFLPSSMHFLLGEWVSEHFYRDLWIESSLYIGAAVFILAVIAVMRRSRLNRAGRLVWPAVLAASAAFILALGIDLHWQGEPVAIRLPGFLRGVLNRDEISPVFLPAYWLFHRLPYFAKMRALMRFGFFTLFFATLLAGLGAGWLLARLRNPLARALAATVLIAAVIFEFYPGPFEQLSPVGPRPVDLWLAEQPGQGAVAQFPAEQLEDQRIIYGFLTSQKPFIGGFFNANQPPQYQRILPVLETFPCAEARDLLRSLDVEYIVVDSAAYLDYPSVDRAIRGLGFELRAVLGGDWIYGFAFP